jgi:hypothetical protein
MNKVLDAATSHFREKINAGMQSITVPEWDNVKVYFKPTVTLKEQSKLIELATQGKSVEALVETLIVKARNEDGTKMFSPAEKVVFMNEVDPSILIRVVSDINSLSQEINDMEKAEKN